MIQLKVHTEKVARMAAKNCMKVGKESRVYMADMVVVGNEDSGAEPGEVGGWG